MPFARVNLGQAERALHDYGSAATHLTESLTTARDLGIREVIVEALCALAAAAAGMDDAERAATLIGAAKPAPIARRAGCVSPSWRAASVAHGE
jgi:hypothetical protein